CGSGRPGPGSGRPGSSGTLDCAPSRPPGLPTWSGRRSSAGSSVTDISNCSRSRAGSRLLSAGFQAFQGCVDDRFLSPALQHPDHRHPDAHGKLVGYVGAIAALGQDVGAGHFGDHGALLGQLPADHRVAVPGAPGRTVTAAPLPPHRYRRTVTAAPSPLQDVRGPSGAEVTNVDALGNADPDLPDERLMHM